MRYSEYEKVNRENVSNTRSVLGRYCYVYRITNVIDNKHYYGSRVSDVHPKMDIGVKYFSSSFHKGFMQEQRNYPDRFKYKVVRVCKDNIDKQLFESYLHYKFNVCKNSSFYNKANQTLTGFDSTGHQYNKGRPLSEETKAKLSKVLTGRVVSEETRQKQREAALRRTKAENLLRGAKHIGKVVSQETRDLQSSQRTGTKNHNAKTILILDSAGVVLHKCNGTFKQVCTDNKYPWTTLRKAKYGKKLYLDVDGNKSRNVPKGSMKFIGWSIVYV